MRLNLRELFSRLNSSYWFVPLVVTLAGFGAAVLLLFLDSPISLDQNGTLALLRPSSAEGARALLSAVIGAMITAISVTFSVTIVALTVASQHFGPRVLNNFVRQTAAQVVLGTFMATFAYSVLVLGAIEGTGPGSDVPELAVAGAVVLVVMSIGALIYYVHYVSTSLQIGEIAADMGTDLRGAIERLYPADERPTAAELAHIPEAPPDAGDIPAEEPGYVQRIDYDAIAEAAGTRDAVVWIRREPGAFVVGGAPLALVHPPEACDAGLIEAVRHASIIGRDRTLWQDPEFAVKQLVEVALRALSPGVNEPSPRSRVSTGSRRVSRVQRPRHHPAPHGWIRPDIRASSHSPSRSPRCSTPHSIRSGSSPARTLRSMRASSTRSSSSCWCQSVRMTRPSSDTRPTSSGERPTRHWQTRTIARMSNRGMHTRCASSGDKPHRHGSERGGLGVRS